MLGILLLSGATRQSPARLEDMDWFSDHAAATWAILALLLAMAEILSVDLFLIMLAAGAGAGAIAALLGAPLGLQAGLALVTSVGLLALVRPPMIKRLHAGPDLKTGADALIGQRATVLREITPFTTGRVKIGGEEWTAAPYLEDDTIPAGAVVDVVRIRGATAYVLQRPELT
jgi:membrane protein implicated in regulation of membrane protease activity